MRTSHLIFSLFFAFTLKAQIPPQNSPYTNSGTYTVEMDSIMNVPTDVLIFKPVNPSGGPYPTILFQPGANGFTSSYINKHSYDLYWEHAASYGYVVIILNNTTGGPNNTLFTEAHDWIKDSVNTTSHWMSSYIDLNNFFVAGHSNGGINATQLILQRPTEVKGILYMASYPNPPIFGMGGDDVSSYSGYVQLICGEEDNTSVPLVGTTNQVARDAYDDFTSVTCKYFIKLENTGHGAFGDYNDPNQPVGSIGRTDATASIRHFLISFLEYTSGHDPSAENDLSLTSFQPSSTLEFLTNCSVNPSGTSENQENDLSLYMEGNTIYISSSLLFRSMECYSLDGKKIYSAQLSSHRASFTCSSHGMILLRITDSHGITHFRKVILP